MALDFTNNTTDRVDHGSDASLDDLDPITYLIWCRPVTATTMLFIDKRQTTDRGYRMLYSASGTNLIFFMDRDNGANAINMEAASFISTNIWQFYAAVADSTGANGDQKLFRGTLTSAPVEPGSYTTQTVGSGTVESNENGPQFVGNRRQFDFNFEGDIAWVGIWNVALTDGQIKAQWMRPHPTSGCVLFTHYGFNGTGAQPDHSGTGNNGTVTGATVIPHVPLAPPWGISIPWVPGTVSAAAAGDEQHKLLLQMQHYGFAGNSGIRC
jgi:hypothetical protein